MLTDLLEPRAEDYLKALNLLAWRAGCEIRLERGDRPGTLRLWLVASHSGEMVWRRLEAPYRVALREVLSQVTRLMFDIDDRPRAREATSMFEARLRREADGA